jgi:hypothetical protein
VDLVGQEAQVIGIALQITQQSTKETLLQGIDLAVKEWNADVQYFDYLNAEVMARGGFENVPSMWDALALVPWGSVLSKMVGAGRSASASVRAAAATAKAAEIDSKANYLLANALVHDGPKMTQVFAKIAKTPDGREILLKTSQKSMAALQTIAKTGKGADSQTISRLTLICSEASKWGSMPPGL